MEIAYAMTGNWFPRTKLHLKEYYRFLRDGTSALPIDPLQLAALQQSLNVTNLAYVGLATKGRFDHVDAQCAGVNVQYFEDGLLTAGVSAGKEIDTDLFRLESFYSERMLPAIAELYSVGLPAISVHDPKYSERPLVLVARSAREEEIVRWLAEYKESVRLSVKYRGYKVYFADRIIIVVTKDAEADMTQHLARMLIFLSEYESRLGHFLDLHRQIWESIEGFRQKKSLKLIELPKIRDHLLDLNRDLSVVSARLAQMGSFLDERRIEIEEEGRTEAFRALEAFRFGKMAVTTQYLRDMWQHLDDYIESTADIIALMYQENFEKSLGKLQFIFLVSSIAGIVLLGNLSTGIFSWEDLVVFGGASLLLSCVIYFGLKLFSARLSRIETKTLLGEQKPFFRREKP